MRPPARMSPLQARMARTALGMSPGDLGPAAKVEAFEAGRLADFDGLWVVAAAFARAGLRFAEAGPLAGAVYPTRETRAAAEGGITPLQVRLARGALGLTVGELRDASGLEYGPVARLDAGVERDAATAEALQAFFEARGVVFLTSGKMAGGVRLAG